ncbi:MAG: glycine cleavage system protein GcvH [Gammaproteobacteria bacterium]|nr:MAG: glycine cleavage system protein GcvH [Gammaproteobacteria bacterium]
MSKIPQNLQYTKTHEWVKKEGEMLIIGITDHAQTMLGDLVYVELPQPDSNLEAHQECAVVESVKAAADVYCPIPGEVVEINEEVIENPHIINQDPYGKGWLIRIRPLDENKFHLLTPDEYSKVVAAEAH